MLSATLFREALVYNGGDQPFELTDRQSGGGQVFELLGSRGRVTR